MVCVTLESTAIPCSNCGCEYDGGDCCEKSLKGKPVNKKYWLVGFIGVEKIGWCAMRENLCRICVLTSRNNLSCDTLQQTMQMLGP